MSKTTDTKTRKTRPENHSLDEIADALKRASEEQQRDLAEGGVDCRQIAQYLEMAPTTTQQWLRVLEENGRATRVYGIDSKTKRPSPSWLPSDHPDAQEPERYR